MAWHMPHSQAGTGSLVGFDLAALGIPDACAIMSMPIWRAPASIRGRICRSISPIIFSALRRSCRASPDACATAPPPAPSPPPRPNWCGPLAAKGWEFAAAGRRMKTFALALGSGGARGLAHIAVIEALDEMGMKPVAIAGTSIGALIGAAYAAGMSGKDLRHHVHRRSRMVGGEMHAPLHAGARRHAHRSACPARISQATQMDAEKFCAQFLPEAVPDGFSALEIPLTVMATDLHRREEAPLPAGPLRPALAASIAIPGMFRPVLLDGRVLIDGGDHQSAALRQARRARRCHRRGRRIRHADGGAHRHAEHLGKPLHTVLVMGSAISPPNCAHAAPDLVIRPECRHCFAAWIFPRRARSSAPAKRQRPRSRRSLARCWRREPVIRAGAL